MGRKPITLLLVIVFALTCLTGCSGEFKTKSVVDAAKKCGMNALSTAEFERRMSGGTFRIIDEYDLESDRSPAYYVSENSETANAIYAKYFQTDTTDVPGLEELVCCENDNSGFGLALFRSVSDDSAKMLYKHWADFFKDDDTVCYSGNKSGYEYTLAYFKSPENEGREDFDCAYIKGRTVILLFASISQNDDRKTLDTFCKSLGLVLPEDAKK